MALGLSDLLSTLGLAPARQPTPFSQVEGRGASLLATPPEAITSSSPISQNLPDSISAYSNFQSRLSQRMAMADPDGNPLVTPELAATIDQVARDRIVRGQSPPSEDEMDDMLASGRTLSPTNPIPERGTGLLDIPGNAIADIRDIFTSIPKLPFLLYEQGRQLPQASEKFSEVMSRPGLQKLGGLDEVPGLNLIPGVYSIGNILSGDWKELAQRPLMNALDIAPVAGSKAFPAATKAQLARRIPKLELGRYMTPEEIVAARTAEPDPVALSKLPAALRDTPQGRAMAVRYTPAAVEESVAKAITPTDAPQSIFGYLGNATPIGRAKDLARLKYEGSTLGKFQRSRISAPAQRATHLANYVRQSVLDMMSPNSPHWASDGKFRNPDLFPDLQSIPKLHEWHTTYASEASVAPSGYRKLADWERRRRELTDRMKTEDFPTLLADETVTPFEKAMLQSADELSRDIVKPYLADDAWMATEGHAMARVMREGREEFHPIAEAQRIEKARVTAESFDHLTRAANATGDINAVTDAALRSWLTGNGNPAVVQFLEKSLPNARRDTLLGHLYALGDQGYDVAAAIDRLKQGGFPIDLLDSLELVSAPHLSVADLQASLGVGPKGRPSPLKESYRAFGQHLREGRYQRALKEYRDHILTSPARVAQLPPRFRRLDPQLVKNTLGRLAEQQKVSNRLSRYSSGVQARRAAKTLERVEANLAPARMFPLIEQAARSRMTEFAQALSTSLGHAPELADQLATYTREGVYAKLQDALTEANKAGLAKAKVVDDMGNPLWPTALDTTALPASVDDLFTHFAGEARNNWAAMADELGQGPAFIHSVSDQRAGHVPVVQPRITSISQAKARTTDFAPGSSDLALALNHQQMEWLLNRGQEDLIRMMSSGDIEQGITAFTATRQELEQHFTPLAQSLAAKYQRPLEAELNRLIERQFKPFDPSQWGASKQSAGTWRQGQLYIDRSMESVLDQLAQPPTIHTVWDPVMNVFRTSVLTLSPRWQIYNLLGNALMMTMQEGVGPWRHLSDARQLIKYYADPENVKVPQALLDKVSDQMRLSLSQLPREAAEYHSRAAQALGKEAAGGARETAQNTLRAAQKGFDKGTDMLVKMNGVVDDAYRLMVYLHNFDKSGAKIGNFRRILAEVDPDAAMTSGRVPAQRAAEQAVRKFMYSWDSMTPYERFTARMIFPFYGFMSHVMRFAYRFAVDHPVRMAVTAGFARSELTDWADGLPQRLRGMIFSQSPKDYTPGTTIKGFNMAGFNPFGDVASMLTLTGWLSQVNPVLSTVAEQFGIDPRTGQANLYPKSAYDPETGRLSLQTRNPVISLMENLIPQTQVLGLSPDAQRLARVDPEASTRMKLSSFGIPMLVRDINLSEESMTAESTRRNAYSQALSQALRNPSASTRYPSLNALQDQMDVLKQTHPEVAAKYSPASVADIQRGIVTNLAGTG